MSLAPSIEDKRVSTKLCLSSRRGRLKPINIATYDPSFEGIRTPVFSHGDNRFSIDWDKNHVVSYSAAELDSYLSGDEKSWMIAGTLRDAEATTIQQAWTGHMSRVAYMARLPFTTPVSVRILYSNPEETFQELVLGDKTTFQGLCYQGKEVFQIPFSREVKAAYVSALDSIPADSIHERSRPLLERAKSSNLIAQLFKQGIQLKNLNSSSQRLQVEPGNNQSHIGFVVFNGDANEAVKSKRAAGLVFEISTVTPEEA